MFTLSLSELINSITSIAKPLGVYYFAYRNSELYKKEFNVIKFFYEETVKLLIDLLCFKGVSDRNRERFLTDYEKELFDRGLNDKGTEKFYQLLNTLIPLYLRDKTMWDNELVLLRQDLERIFANCFTDNFLPDFVANIEQELKDEEDAEEDDDDDEELPAGIQVIVKQQPDDDEDEHTPPPTLSFVTKRPRN